MHRLHQQPGRLDQPSSVLFADLARRLGAEQDRDGVLQRVLDAAVLQVDGAEHAGVTLVATGSVTTPVASSDLVRDVDRHQYAIGEGPCLSAALEHEDTVRVDDLRTDPRWPQFSEAATDLDVSSMLSFRLYVSTGAGARDTMGALNLYASAPHAFTDDDVRIGAVLAAHAAVAAAAAEHAGHLRNALQSRDVIGQAKGILMERFAVTSDQAFDLLVTASQRTHTKLRDVAERLIATGEIATSGSGTVQTDPATT